VTVHLENLLRGFAILTLTWFTCLSSMQAEDGKPADYQAVAPAANDQRTKVVTVLTRKLGQFKLQGKLIKEADDFYVVGTADVNLQSRHADIRFFVKQGKEDVAEFLADYILAPPDGLVHQWHVFYRVKGPEQGQEALLAVRNQYDQVRAYRAQMQRIYNAKTTRRC